MDRLRDVSRRGNPSSGGQSPNLRRPRSSGGFKDPADEEEGMEDLHSGRLRDRFRKEGNIHSVTRLKRTRHSSRELHGRTEEAEKTEVGEPCPIDEDDLPISPNLLPKKHSKLKFHGKLTSDEAVTVEIPAVPRKARTAISKRPHESNHGDSPRHQICTSAPRLSNTIGSSQALLESSLKPVKRMKHSSAKFKMTKLTKAPESAVISQQEVEVAEALFDLARMVANLGSPGGNDQKADVQTENSEMRGAGRAPSPEGLVLRRQDSVSTPQTSHSAVSSPVRGPIRMTSSHQSSTDGPTNRMPVLKMKVDDGAVSQLKEDINGSLLDQKSLQDMCPGQSVGSNAPADIKLSATVRSGQESHPKASSYSALALQSQSSVVADNSIMDIDAKGSCSPTKPVDNSRNLEQHFISDTSPPKEFPDQKQHLLRQNPQEACDKSALVKERALKSTQPCKYEIDLMASPNASASGTTEKISNSADSEQVSNKQIQDRESSQNNQNHLKQLFKESSTEEEKQSLGKEAEGMLCSVRKEEVAEQGIQKETENDSEKHFTKALKYEAFDSIGTGKANLIPDQTAGGSGWPGSVSHTGYYPAAAAAAAAAAAVAAAWPATGSVIGPSSLSEKSHPCLLVPPFPFAGAKPFYKRCAMHVYIAHMVDTQQQMQRHPVWAATYGKCASGSLYSARSNCSSTLNLEPKVVLRSGFSGPNSSSVNNVQANKQADTGSGLQNETGSIAAMKEPLTAQNGDDCARKEVSQSMLSDSKIQTVPIQGNGLGSGCSPTQHNSTSLGNGAPNKGISAVQNCGLGSYPELARVSMEAPSSTEIVNTATAQVQYLQAIMQQAGFPFSFSPGHLIPPMQGHSPQQQATSFLNSPFYSLPFVTSQQNPATVKTSSNPGNRPTTNGDLLLGQAGSQPLYQQQFSSASLSHSQPRNVSQPWQHLGDEINLGRETVSSVESNFPGYQRNMYGHEICDGAHASNIVSSSSSLNSAGQSVVLPAQVALAAKQMTGLKLPQAAQFQDSPPDTVQYSGLAGSRITDFQTAHPSLGMQMGSISNNMVGPGPLGFASVAAIMAPHGHTVLQTSSDSPLSIPPTYQESCNMLASSLSLDGARASSVLGMPDGKKLPAFKQSCPVKTDRVGENGVTGTSLNLMNGAVGNSGLGHGTPVGVALNTPWGGGRADALANATAYEPASSRGPPPSLLFHVPNVASNQGTRQVQIACQYASQAKPASLHSGTPGVSTTTSTLHGGACTAVVPLAKQQSYPSKNGQASVNSVQSRFPPIGSGSSGNLVSSLNSVSKASLTAASKNFSMGKSSSNSVLKHSSTVPAKKPDVILAHLPGQVVGPSSMTVPMGQSQLQQPSQHQQMGHIARQQQQQQQEHQWPQEQKQVLHQEQRQHSSQNTQQFHVIGLPPGISLQYHQAQSQGTGQSLHMGPYNQSTLSQQAKQQSYLEQHFFQSPQQQSHLTDVQHSALMGIQPHSYPQNVALPSSRSVQQVSEVQACLQHSSSSRNQSVPLGRPGATSIMAQALPFSVGNSFGGRTTSSDGNLSQVSSPKPVSGMKLPGVNVSVGSTNMQKISNSNIGIQHFQGMSAKAAETGALAQSSSISYMPYLQSATFSCGIHQDANVLGALGGVVQSGLPMKSIREGSIGSEYETSTSFQHDGDKSSLALKGPAAMNSYSACTSAPKSLASLAISPCMALATSCCPSTPAHGSQPCTATSATMAADSVSTTG